jgi:hypothetical protein
MQNRVVSLRGEFQQFLSRNNNFTEGRVVSVEEVRPSSKLTRRFCERKSGPDVIGIMFHGTHSDNILLPASTML